VFPKRVHKGSKQSRRMLERVKRTSSVSKGTSAGFCVLQKGQTGLKWSKVFLKGVHKGKTLVKTVRKELKGSSRKGQVVCWGIFDTQMP
jgi:hypothetical protein